MIGQLIKTENNSELQTHTITRVTKTRACWPGGSIAKVNLCKVGDFWLEMSPPEKAKPKKKVKSPSPEKPKKKPKSKKRGRPKGAESINLGGIEYVNAASAKGLDIHIGTIYKWRDEGHVKSCKIGGWSYFKLSDIIEWSQKNNLVGRMIDGKQYYTVAEIGRRLRVSRKVISSWIKPGNEAVDCVREKGAIIVLSWAGVQQHIKVWKRGKL